jgi:PTS system N-acetylglucosamine-specific IIC component
MMLAIGAAMFVLYYSLAVFFIKKFNLATIGRESEEEITAAQLAETASDSLEMQYINALGGAENLVNVDACTTRLRLKVRDSGIINKPILKALGAKGFVTPAPDSVQVILGPQAEIVASSIRDTLALIGHSQLVKAPVKHTTAETLVNKDAKPKIVSDLNATENILAALGGKNNLISANLVALTRVKIEIRDANLINQEQLKASGVIGFISTATNVWQLYLGTKAEGVADGLSQLMK